MNKKSVLIVEDDKWLSEHYFRLLLKAGYRAKITTNAIDAIKVIDKKPPDVIILDVLLTGSTAFALLHELQSYGDTGVIPVILCTNLADELFLKDLDVYGVRQIIDKTKMKPNDLLKAVKNVV